jgi:hypothetical protein
MSRNASRVVVYCGTSSVFDTSLDKTIKTLCELRDKIPLEYRDTATLVVELYDSDLDSWIEVEVFYTVPADHHVRQ